MAVAVQPDSPAPERADLALVLVGGGARAAYQVGFLRSLVRRHPAIRLPIITGTSAGAINAAYLAARTGSVSEAVEELGRLWSAQTVDQVFRVDSRSLFSHLLRWGIQLTSGGAPITPRVRGLLDTTPLRMFLNRSLHPAENGEIEGIARNIEAGRLRALAITTSSYSTGQSVIWVQGGDIQDWKRPNRRSRRTAITVEHIMASAALPLFFPAIRLDDGWYGDGGIRMVTVPHPVPWTHICAMPPGVAHTPRAPRSACDTQASRDARSGCTAPRSRPRRRGRPRGSERFGRGSLAP